MFLFRFSNTLIMSYLFKNLQVFKMFSIATEKTLQYVNIYFFTKIEK